MTNSRLLTVDEAVAAVLGRVQPSEPHFLPLPRAVGLVLAQGITADIDMPPFAKATMDGFAVRSGDFLVPGERRLQVVGMISAGQTSERAIEPGEGISIMTGAPLPAGADAVIRVERTRPDPLAANQVVINTSVAVPAGQFVLDRGREMRQGDVLLESGTIITPRMIGLIASAGRKAVRVHPRPSVAVVSTGDELVWLGRVPGPGQIRDSNGPMLNALVDSWAERSGAGRMLPSFPVPDQTDALTEALGAELQRYDVLIVTGGVSAGVKDLVPATLLALGVEPVFHKVAVKPGKPIWFGVGSPRISERPGVRPGTLVFGLPGNPAGAVVGFLLFVRPALDALAGRGSNPTPVEPARLGADFQHRGDRPTYHPVRVEGDRVFPLDWAGSADLRTVALADGFAAFASGDHDYLADDPVKLLRFP